MENFDLEQCSKHGAMQTACVQQEDLASQWCTLQRYMYAITLLQQALVRDVAKAAVRRHNSS